MLAEIRHKECFVLHLLIVCAVGYLSHDCLPEVNRTTDVTLTNAAIHITRWCWERNGAVPPVSNVSIYRSKTSVWPSTGPWAPPAQRQRAVPGGSCPSWGSATPNGKPRSTVALTETAFGNAKDLCVVLKPHDWANFPTWKGLLLATRDMFFSIYFIYFYSHHEMCCLSLCVSRYIAIARQRTNDFHFP